MKKLLICFMMFLSLAVFMQVTPVSAADDQEATIYGLGSNYTSKISIPTDLPTQYSLGYTRGTKYNVVSGTESVEVSSKGEVTVRKNYKYDSAIGFYLCVTPGDAVIEITANGETRVVTIHVVDYSTVYADQKLDEYIKANISEDMSDSEKLDAIIKFATQYDYKSSSSSLVDMVIKESCNDRSASEAVVKLAEKLGYDAWTINETKYTNSRKLAMVKIGEKYYQIDAGQDKSKDNGYRPYEMITRTSLFRYEVEEGTAKITSYDGKEAPEVLEVPSYIDGYKVTWIYQKGLAELDSAKIVLPDTVVTLDFFAFSDCKNLKEIEIPASVTEIPGGLFLNCTSLETITVAKGNNNFKSEDNAVYSKDGSKLIAAPMVSALKVPDTVTEIGDYFFYDNTNLRSVEIPSSVKTISARAFQGCTNLTDVKMAEGVENIEEMSFAEDAKLSLIRIPSTVKTIGHYAFYKCSSLSQAYFYGDVPEFPWGSYGADGIFQNCSLTAYYPTGNTTWDASARTNKHGATQLSWVEWDPSNVQSILDAQITFPGETYKYTGKAFTPAITVTLQGKTLTQGTDYIVSYFDNVNAGTAQVQVTGCGNYEGVIKSVFQIEKARHAIKASLTKTTLMVGETTKFTSVSPANCEFISRTPEIATVTSQGVITAVAPGTAKFAILDPGDENYQRIEVDIAEITVIPDPNATPTPAPTSTPGVTATPGAITTPTPGAITTATPGAVTTPTPGAVTTATPGAVTTPTPGDIATATPGAVTTPDPSESDQPEVPTETPAVSDQPEVPTETPVVSDQPEVPTETPAVSDQPEVPTETPAVSDQPTVPTATPGGSDKPSNPTQTPGATNKPSSTPTQKPATTKAPASTNDGNGSVAVGSTVTYKNAKYRITGKNTAEFTGLVKGKTVNIPDTITVGGKVYKITSIAAKACRDNTKITKLVIGKNVKKIGKEAFYNCTKLKNINCKSALLKAGKIKKNAFKGISTKVVLKVRKAQKALYKKLFVF